MLRAYQYTHTRYDHHDAVIQRDVGTIERWTTQTVKHAIVKRFGLQAWSPWSCLADGTYQRTHTWTEERPYRGIITVRPIAESG